MGDALRMEGKGRQAWRPGIGIIITAAGRGEARERTSRTSEAQRQSVLAWAAPDGGGWRMHGGRKGRYATGHLQEMQRMGPQRARAGSE